MTGMYNKLQVSVRFRLTPVMNSSVYAITCVSLARLFPMTENLAHHAKVELCNAELAGKV